MSGIMPAGSQPPKADTPAPGDNADGKAAADNGGQGQSEPILGKFKSQDDLIKSYQELENKLSETGAQNKQLTELLLNKNAAPTEPAKPAEPEGPSYDEQLAAIQQDVEDGKLTVAEGIVKSSNLAAEHATQQALTRSEKMQQEKAIKSEQAAFLEQHPDFEELKRTGVLDKVKKNMPHLHDDFSAYFQHKATVAMTEADEARRQGEEKGKQEAARIADGDRRTKKVLQQPGKSAAEVGRTTTRKSAADIKASMLARLNALDS